MEAELQGEHSPQLIGDAHGTFSSHSDCHCKDVHCFERPVFAGLVSTE